VYLAGPIAGTDKGKAFEWREYVTDALTAYGIATLSPMRAKDQLRRAGIGADYSAYHDMGWAYTPAGILTRDHHDCTTSDAVFMNVLGAKDKSFGTGMELAWCYDRHIPVVVAIEDVGNVHDKHPMFVAAVKFRVVTLDEAIEATATILGR
jgi:nucleoside 2-deoxyribosyltransferase